MQGAIITTGLILALIASTVYFAISCAKSREKQKNAAEGLNDAKKANSIRNRVRTDPEYRKRVQSKFDT